MPAQGPPDAACLPTHTSDPGSHMPCMGGQGDPPQGSCYWFFTPGLGLWVPSLLSLWEGWSPPPNRQQTPLPLVDWGADPVFCLPCSGLGSRVPPQALRGA